VNSNRMRVLFLTPYFRPYLGGIERAIEGLAFEYLASPQVEAVGVLTGKYAFPRVPHPDWADRETTPEGINILRLSSFPLRSLPIYSVPLVWFPPSQIRRYIREFNPTVIHFVGDGWFWGHLWSWAWARKSARLVFTPSFHTLPWSRQWLRMFNVPLCKMVDDVVALTEMERDRVRSAYRVPDKKLSVIGWGVNTPATSRTTTPRTSVQILCVGRLGDHKGQMWLLDAYRQARQRFISPAHVVLVGRDEGGEAQIQEAVQSWGLEDEVIITGEVSDEDLETWYVESDIFALFSRYEAFGLVYFEAMASGLPVLTHDVGANRELLTRGSVVVPTFNSAAAADALVRLVNDESSRRELGADGREYAHSNFTWPVVAQRYLDLYQGMG
jgi:glycosyltransferase involved in cell wall biosynthesis